MDKTKVYLVKKINELHTERNKKASAYKQNQIIIAETDKAIKKIEKVSDVAMEMFSPKVRETNSFNKQEIADLEMKIVTISQQNKDLHYEITRLEKEIKLVNDCIGEIDNYEKKVQINNSINEKMIRSIAEETGDMKESDNKEETSRMTQDVSRETFDYKRTKDKLMQIKGLIYTDQQRAVVEIKKVIDDLK